MRSCCPDAESHGCLADGMMSNVLRCLYKCNGVDGEEWVGELGWSGGAVKQHEVPPSPWLIFGETTATLSKIVVFISGPLPS